MSFLEKILRAVCRILEWILRPFCTPAYNPAPWNFQGTSSSPTNVQLTNNCYNYATNIQTDTFAQPGRASGVYTLTPPPDCAGVDRGAVSDGLKPVDCDSGCGCRGCCDRVALAVSLGSPALRVDEAGDVYEWPLYDYHFYRLDSNGLWSHKPGGSPVTNRDASGNLISDPRTCNRGPYTTFCGCYCVCKGQVRIR
jgi:hypothetical protein